MLALWRLREREVDQLAKPNPADEALARFMRRIWRQDIAPLLRDRRARERRRIARLGGQVAAAGGLLVDTVFRLRGKPFTRFMTVMGASLGAMLPDAWDWRWLRESATPDEREEVARRVRRRAAELLDREAGALLGVRPEAGVEAIKLAWRQAARRWHPDRAPDAARRAEYQVRFIAYQAAYERLMSAAQRERDA